MPKRRNPNLAKIHRSYLVGEVAELLGVHKNTVRDWVSKGLPVNDDLRPMLILGRELREFLKERNQKSKHPCKVNEMFCLKCRVPKIPAEKMVEYIPMTDMKGQLTGICPTCDCMMNRFANLSKLEVIGANLELTIRDQ